MTGKKMKSWTKPLNSRTLNFNIIHFVLLVDSAEFSPKWQELDI